jgi:hypothetical protein
MNLDDLKTQWEVCDRRLTESIRLNTRLLRESGMQRARGSLGWLSLGVAVELALGIALLVMFGSYLAAHIREPRFFLPGLVLHLSVIAQVGFAIHQLIALGTIDYAGPVLDIQRRLGTLHRRRIQVTKWTIVTAPLLWTPLFIVAMNGFLGVDAYATFDRVWLAGNLVFGIAAVPALQWAARRFAHRFGHHSWMRSLMDDVAGKSLAEASRFIAELKGLEEDTTPA